MERYVVDDKKIPDSCILLKRSEYDELVKKAKEVIENNRQKEIKVVYSLAFNSSNDYYNGYHQQLHLRKNNVDDNITGDFILTNDLRNEIFKIIFKIKDKFNKIINDKSLDVTNTINIEKNKVFNDTVEKFSKLHWFDRLFFDKKTIKNSYE